MPTYYKPWNVATDFTYEELADGLIDRLDQDDPNASAEVGVQGEYTLNKEPWKPNRKSNIEE